MVFHRRQKSLSPNTVGAQAAGNGRRKMRRIGRYSLTEWGAEALNTKAIRSARRAGSFLLGWTKTQLDPLGVKGNKLGVNCLPKNSSAQTANQIGGRIVLTAAYSEKLSAGQAHGKFRYGSTSASLSLTLSADDHGMTNGLWFSYLTLLLVTILAQAFFTLVGSNFVSFTFFSARHTASNVISYEL